MTRASTLTRHSSDQAALGHWLMEGRWDTAKPLVREPDRPSPVSVRTPQPRRVRRRLRAADLLLPLAVVMWAMAVRGADPDAMNDWGLLRVLPVAFFAALGLLVVSIAVVLSDVKLSNVRLTLHLAVLVIVLHGTVPLLLPVPNYPWVYKHIGVVGYIGTHGGLDSQIDIYHNWPGFFALAAWFSKIAGVGSPLAFAAWAPVYFNAIISLELAFIFRSLPVARRTRWLGLFLFVPGNWVGQDYFAPQAMAVVLSLAVFGMTLAWLQADRPTALARVASRVARWAVRARVSERRELNRATLLPGRRVAKVIALFAVYAVLVVTHQLTPYAIIIGLALLTTAGLIRPRWVVVALAAIAVAYLLLRLPYVQRTQDLFGSFFDPWRNVNGNGFGESRAQLGRRLTALGAPALMLGLWALGAVGVVRRVRAGRPTMVLALLAGSPILIALGQSYGGEAVFRIYLFSLPWTALLAASAIEPRSLRRRARNWGKFGLVLMVAITLFMFAFYGSEELYRVRVGEVHASRHFYETAEPGSVLVLVAPRFPARVAANYDQFITSDSSPSLLESVKTFRHRVLGVDDLRSLARFVTQYVGGSPGNAYLALSTDQQVYAEVLGLSPPGSMASLDRTLARSRAWQLVCRNSDAALYRFSRDVRSEDGSDCRVPPTQPITSARPLEWVSGIGVAALGLGLLGLVRRGRRLMMKRHRVVPDEATTGVDAEELLRQAMMASDNRDSYRLALKSFECDAPRIAELVLGVEAGHRPAAIRLLMEVWGPLPAHVLQPLLDDPWGCVRTAALEALDASAADAELLLGLLRNDLCADARAAAVRALAHAPESDQLSALSEALADPDPVVRATAVLVLPVAGDRQAVGLVIEASRDPNAEVREAANGRLAAADSWVLWMALEKWSLRDELCAVLEARAPDRVVALALERLTSPEPQERALAVELAGRVRTPECISGTITALRDTDVRVRRAAAAELGQCPQAVSALAGALYDPDSLVRLRAAQALGGLEHDDALSALVGGLQDPDPGVQRAAIEALARRGSPGLARRVAGAMTTKSGESSAEVLLRMGSSGELALVAALEEGPSDRAAAAAGVLKESGMTEWLSAALESIDPEVRLRAVEALGRLGGPDALDGLVTASSDPWERIRSQAAHHLSHMADGRRFEETSLDTARPPELVRAMDEASLIAAW